LPLLFRSKRLSEQELVAHAGQQLRHHGVNAPLRSEMKAARFREEGKLEEARRWQAIAAKLRVLMAEAT
jgi:hypothetical protein